MKIGVLTSSRADFGIYLPLLKALSQDSFFHLEIIAFGTHLSNFHGYTLQQIRDQGFNVKYTVDSMSLSDSADAISSTIGLTTIKFSSFWKDYSQDFDYVLSLGDRYEMFAAVTAGIPFQVKFVHFHGGEKTLGAIDNVFRHAISHASSVHFVATEAYAARLKVMLDTTEHIYNVGAMSLQNLFKIDFLTKPEFKEKWKINLERPTVLMTFHPETVHVKSNVTFAMELVDVVKSNIDLQFLITMPNADTAGNEIRSIFMRELQGLENIFMIENLGTQSYFTAMKYCSFLLGNTSSGIIEAASFGKYVINIGERQAGRMVSNNVFQTSISKEAIQEAIKTIQKNDEFNGENVYFKDNSVQCVINTLKEIDCHG